MKKRYEYGGEIDAMEEANNRSEMTPRRVSLPPRGPKEMGDASAAEEAGQFGDAGTSRIVKATPKAMPKAASKPAAKPAAKAESKSEYKPAIKASEMPADESKMSVAERAKMSRERARAGSGTTDTRSVGERLRSALAGKDRGGNTVDFAGSGMGMKRGGSVKPSKMGGVKTAKPSFGSASSRADGIASKGKTRGKYI
jgi:pyruvate,orthophosphate dikinase